MYPKSVSSDKKLSLLLIIFLVGLPQVSETIYTPSLPDIASSLHVASSLVEWSLSIYFIGFAVGVGLWGKISDHIGRRKAMLFGLLFYCIGSFSCMLSLSIDWLFISRFIQAFGASTGSIITMTMMRDVYSGKERNQIFSTVGMALALAPALGPLVGGYVAQWFHWKANFIVLLALGLPLLIYSLFFLPETHPDLGKKADSNLLSLFKLLLKDKNILIAALLVGGFNGILFSYYAEAPFIFINVINYLPGEYGSLGFIIALASIAGSFSAKRLNRVWETEKIILLGCLITTFSMFTLVLDAYLGYIVPANKKLAVLTLLTPMLGFFIGFGIAIPNILSTALAKYQAVVGAAGSIFGLIYYGLISLFLFVMGLIHDGTVMPMPTYFFFLSFAMTFIYYIFIYVNRANHLQDNVISSDSEVT